MTPHDVVRVTRDCPNCRVADSMWLLCDPRMDLEWFQCSCCGHVVPTEDNDA